ncbi:MAG: beta-propeller domain-containing protein [Candidatus Kerfeldbacteria bacterium]|nr:beta-propeller domain-containing protein [Candidatus Kerfeldbacteria bacterium]
MAASHRLIRLYASLVLIAGIVAVGLVVVAFFLRTPATKPPPERAELKTFASCSALNDYLKDASENRPISLFGERATVGVDTAAPSKSADYSTTNIQVAGVDEPDLVKTDGETIVIVSGDTLMIATVGAGGAPTLASRSKLTIQPSELFFEGDRVVVFGTSDEYLSITDDQKSAPSIYPYYRSAATVQVWDVRDRRAPTLVKTLTFDGTYVTARLTNGEVYFVVNAYPRYDVQAPADDTVMPQYRESSGGAATVAVPVARCADVVAPPDMYPEQYVILGSFRLAAAEPTLAKEVVLGSGQTVYATAERLYLAGTFYEPIRILPLGVLPQQSSDATVVHVFNLGTAVAYDGEFTVPGHVLNQFSLDEHGGVFRIATTRGVLSRTGSGTTNNVYLFRDRKQVGALEDLAPGESIYSARFMGDRAYLVTFQKVDPLFALDLADPANPKILGKLKIPGYSDYLHPYDETHLIGVGKEAVAAEEGNFAWYQGLKLALFDVSDATNPVQLHSVAIGDRGTDSYALHDHKAFLFDRAKNLLVIPVLLAELPDAAKQGSEPTAYGDFTYQGAFVYDLTLENGFQERSRITHLDSAESFQKSGYAYYDDGYSVRRSFFINDTLYTVSTNQLRANALTTLEPLETLSVCETECQTTEPLILK